MLQDIRLPPKKQGAAPTHEADPKSFFLQAAFLPGWPSPTAMAKPFPQGALLPRIPLSGRDPIRRSASGQRRPATIYSPATVKSVFSSSQADRSGMATSSWVMVSRSRTVTLPVSRVSKSMVMQ